MVKIPHHSPLLMFIVYTSIILTLCTIVSPPCLNSTWHYDYQVCSSDCWEPGETLWWHTWCGHEDCLESKLLLVCFLLYPCISLTCYIKFSFGHFLFYLIECYLDSWFKRSVRVFRSVVCKIKCVWNMCCIICFVHLEKMGKSYGICT